MADTRRSKATLQGLLADNVSGDISAQDIRDVCESVHPENTVKSGTVASLPGSGQLTGDLYLATDSRVLYRWNGSAWIAFLNGMPGVVQGRLTLVSATPVPTTDQTGKTTVYFTPFNGNHISLPTASAVWIDYTFSELSVALGTLTSGANYDVFAYDVAGAVTLKIGPAWASDTSRGTGAGTTELDLQDGVYVNKVSITSGPGAKAGVYLGTFRTTSTTETEDSAGGTSSQVGGKRFLWNMYNRVQRGLSVIDTTDNWSYTTNTWRQAGGASGNKVEFLAGLDTAEVSVQIIAAVSLANNSARVALIAAGIDSTSSPSGIRGHAYHTSGSGSNFLLVASYRAPTGLGYHFLARLEKGADGTCAFIGDNGADGTQSGLNALGWS